MQQISLSDDIEILWKERPLGEHDHPEDGSKLNIRITTNRKYLPTDSRNLAYKAALLMEKKAKSLGKEMEGELNIDIFKRIPVAAGLAGGSGNGAAVLIGVNRLWELGLDTKELCEVATGLGSDVPFMVLVQNSRYTCALGTGRGERLTPVSRDLDMCFLLAKPKFGVSTKEVYKGLDESGGYEHPDRDALIKALEEGNTDEAIGKMGNVLETYTLKAYPEVDKLKHLIEETDGVRFSMMSGSGPTVIGFYDDLGNAKKAAVRFKELGYESFYAGNMRRNRGKNI